MKKEHINLDDYNYDLPEDRIAQYPVQERDMSRLLIYRNKEIFHDTFKNINIHIPAQSLLVFNNTRVIRARILFNKVSGAVIEVLCLEPLFPSDYETSLGSEKPVIWKCLVGNLKKWKTGIISTSFKYLGNVYELTAEKIETDGETSRILFRWNCSELSFGEVIEMTGHIPLPPYLNRQDEPEDLDRYQTVYSLINGSVAAPTAGLHFTDHVIDKLQQDKIKSTNITLHVGAGTFKPVKSKDISDHKMHCEHFIVHKETIDLLLENQGNIITVGTTSVRTIESLFWLGVKLTGHPLSDPVPLSLGQWDAYEMNSKVSVTDSMNAILSYLKMSNLPFLEASTSIIIVPGYQFKMTNGIITNFHQPCSTLLLLISAWTGSSWKEIYRYALENDFRFLSYGDCSLLIR